MMMLFPDSEEYCHHLLASSSGKWSKKATVIPLPPTCVWWCKSSDGTEFLQDFRCHCSLGPHLSLNTGLWFLLQVCNLWETLRSGKLSTQHYGAEASRNPLEAAAQEAAAALMETVGIAAAMLVLPLHPVRGWAAPVKSARCLRHLKGSYSQLGVLRRMTAQRMNMNLRSSTTGFLRDLMLLPSCYLLQPFLLQRMGTRCW